MERRSGPRFAANEPVVVTELGNRRLHPKGGLVEEISGTGMRLRLAGAIACGTPVKVETHNMLMLGEVLRCEPAGDEFHLAVKLHHALRDLRTLEQMNRAIVTDKPDGEQGRGERSTAEEPAGQEELSLVRPRSAPIMRE